MGQVMQTRTRRRRRKDLESFARVMGVCSDHPSDLLKTIMVGICKTEERCASILRVQSCGFSCFLF